MTSNNNLSLEEKAQRLAKKHHKGQFRESSTLSVLDHLAEVAKLVKMAGGSREQVAAAWAHDLLKYGKATIEEVRAELGEEVAILVHKLTDTVEIHDLPPVERRKERIKRVEAESEAVRLLQIAIQISDLCWMATAPPKSWHRNRRLDYVDNAFNISLACMKISEKLDDLFRESYKRAMEVLLSDRSRL